MKANIAVPHRAFEGSFHSLNRNPDFLAFAGRIVALARLAFDKVVKALRPVSFEEHYLDQAQNHADLERRVFELYNGRREQSRRFFW